MFHLSSEPLLLSQAGIQGLCPSLNTPVLNIEELPVGSANAAIVLFDDGYGTLSLGVGIHSVETRQVAVFVYRGVVDESKTPAEAMNAALAFAEGMGFLFDEDVVSSEGGGKARALEIWTTLTSCPQDQKVPEPVPVPATPMLSSPPPAAHELVLDDLIEEITSSEILLEELSGAQDGLPDESDDSDDSDDLDLELDHDGFDEIVEFDALPAAPSSTVPPVKVTPKKPAARAPSRVRSAAVRPSAVASPAAAPALPTASAAASVPPEPMPRRVPLSRFRQPAERAPAAPDANPDPVRAERRRESDSGSSQLGRISLVRRRRAGDAVDERPSLLLRILSSF